MIEYFKKHLPEIWNEGKTTRDLRLGTGKEHMINCLAYALRYWDKHPNYKIYYNSVHATNSEYDLSPHFLPAEEFGYIYFSNAFAGLLDNEELLLLKKYFNVD